MRIIFKNSVLDEARKRFTYLFDEFDEVILSYSGGKDSTVVFHLAYDEAQRRGINLKVLFLDQEAEYEHTIKMVKYVRDLPGITMYWLQVPFKLFNSSTHGQDEWLECWGSKGNWIREKEQGTIQENILGVEHFHDIFPAFLKTYFTNKKTCYIAGVRAEESPARLLGTTRALTYKHITWGKKLDKNKLHYTFYPVYDWTYKDVWKYINENNFKYNKIYDYQYQYGEKISAMRVSSLTHETALHHINFLKEVESKLYNALTERIEGISTYNKLEEYIPKDLPNMFKDMQNGATETRIFECPHCKYNFGTNINDNNF